MSAGLLTGHPHPRSNYVVSAADADRLVVRAADWLTSFNVGLNELELRHVAPDTIRFRVQYWRWALYALGLSGGLGVGGVIMLLTLDVRGYIARHENTMIPGFSVEQNLAIAWAMAIFWGFIWPWLLIAMHKGPVRKLVARLVAEVDANPV